MSGFLPPVDDDGHVRIALARMTSPRNEDRPAYTIDADDRIILANPAWFDFVADDPWSRADDECIGRSVWELRADRRNKPLWEVLYGRVRAIGASVFVPMRVDTSAERRLIDLEVRPLADRCIQHVCDPVWSEPRPAVPLLDPRLPRDGRKVRICAWCMRVQVRLGAWQEIEDAQRELGVEPAETLPRLARDACVTCKQSLLKTFPARVA